jgi:hypothetical protein
MRFVCCCRTVKNSWTPAQHSQWVSPCSCQQSLSSLPAAASTVARVLQACHAAYGGRILLSSLHSCCNCRTPATSQQSQAAPTWKVYAVGKLTSLLSSTPELRSEFCKATQREHSMLVGLNCYVCFLECLNRIMPVMTSAGTPGRVFQPHHDYSGY